MRVKFDFRTASKENYLEFIKKHPDSGMSYNRFLCILYAFNEEFRTYLLETGKKGKLPGGIGNFAIKKKKRQKVVTDPNTGIEYINLPVDWVKTMQKGKRVFNFNYHTEGFYFGYIWFKYKAKFKHSNFWYFKSTRASARLLKHYLTIDKKYQHLYQEWPYRS